jgi:hypothetical protein
MRQNDGSAFAWWHELDYPQRDAFPGDSREWKKKDTKTAKLNELGEKLLGIRSWS